MIKHGVIPLVIATLGLSIAVKSIVRAGYSAEAHPFPSPFANGQFSVAGVAVSYADLGTLIVAGLIVIGLQMFLTKTVTGRAMQVHSTVIPRFTVGGRLTFHGMTAFVFEDADYTFAQSKYQVQGVLGYAALSALSSVTVTDNATIELHPRRQVQTQENPAPNYDGARFFLDGDQIIVALGLAPNEQMFALDAAGQQTYFSSRYYDEHAQQFAGRKAEPFTIPGAKALPPQPAYMAETLPLQFGGAKVDVHYIEVLTQPVGSAALDDVYGVLGVDALDQLRSYTFDYQNMRCRVSE